MRLELHIGPMERNREFIYEDEANPSVLVLPALVGAFSNVLTVLINFPRVPGDARPMAIPH